MKISDLRREYVSQGLHRSDLSDDPFEQFQTWFSQAEEADLPDVNALSLASVGSDGQPSVRTVLLKAMDEEGFTFFTNYNSHKARQLAEHQQAAMLFPWLALNRQIIIEGRCEKVTASESDEYFASRPRGSQLGAWASAQSEVIADRESLEAHYRELESKYGDTEIPRPSHWGGYRLYPVRFEFWQGRENRLHDRFQYDKTDGTWRIRRLQP